MSAAGKLIQIRVSDEEQKESNFDVSKYLKLFADDVGCEIDDIASSLQNQSNNIKEKNWQKLAKNDELTEFVDIYRIVMGLIAYTLITKQMTNKQPSTNSVKALTLKLVTKLPKYNDKPRLTKFEYMNTLHNLLYQIYEQEIIVRPESTSSQKTGKTQEYVAISQQDIESEMDSHPNSDHNIHLQIGTICTCLQYENDGIDYKGKQCMIKQPYNQDFCGYFVEFTNFGHQTYITADKLKLLSVTRDTETIDMDTLNGDMDEDNNNNNTVNYIISVCYEKLPARYTGRVCLCQMICMLILLILIGICSWGIDYGRQMMQNVDVEESTNDDDSEYPEPCCSNYNLSPVTGMYMVVIFSIVMVIAICCLISLVYHLMIN